MKHISLSRPSLNEHKDASNRFVRRPNQENSNNRFTYLFALIELRAFGVRDPRQSDSPSKKENPFFVSSQVLVGLLMGSVQLH